MVLVLAADIETTQENNQGWLDLDFSFLACYSA
jgi:hypothetical protein